VDAYPQGVQVKNGSDNLPLHIACSKAASLDVIKYLVNAYPEDAQITTQQDCLYDDEGLPLHVALSCDAPLDAIKFLLDTYPQGAQVTTTYASNLPHHIACGMKEGSLAALSILAECYPAGMDQWG